MNYDEVLKVPLPTVDVYYFLFLLKGKQVKHVRIDALELYSLEASVWGCKMILWERLWKYKGD